MPTDLLLPAFALTLLVNAAFVAMAVRGLLHARTARDREDVANRVRLESRAPAAPAAVTADTIVAEASRARARETDPRPKTVASKTAKPPRRKPTPGATLAKPATSKLVGPRPASPKPAASKTRVPRPLDPAKRSRPSDDGASPRSETRRGGRRRFSLPPLDEDHERVNRSIKTFLTGSDGVDDGATVADPPTVATTVALVAIDGLDAHATAADPDEVEGLVASVERTLRGAARSADRVSAAGSGRFRVVLPATGELAARAYLRRVRATVGPSLEAADGPLGLVTATATVLDDTVHVAVAQAEARLDAALASAARQMSGAGPRVAPD